MQGDFAAYRTKLLINPSYMIRGALVFLQGSAESWTGLDWTGIGMTETSFMSIAGLRSL